MMKILIREGGLQSPEVIELLTLHLNLMRSQSPACSAHVLEIDDLDVLEVTFLTAWDEHFLVGCGALKTLDDQHGEIKSMHTVHAHRGKGVAVQLLKHNIQIARERSYNRISLETGSMETFAPARTLYSRFGFEYCGPFGSYIEDPNTNFMTLTI